MRRALLAGATGLIGGMLLEKLLASPEYARVIVLARRPLPRAHDKLQVEIVDFGRLPALPAVDDVFCCLGTTIRKAGSQEAFRRVDHDYVLALAQRARAAGSARFLMVSALGADASSRVFYNRVKGETERDIAVTGLDAWFFRPSLLDGPREENRPGERLALVVMRVIGPLMVGPLARYRAIPASTVAQAMLRVAGNGQPAPGPIESEQIQGLG